MDLRASLFLAETNHTKENITILKTNLVFLMLPQNM